jgi:hypothetical protein
LCTLTGVDVRYTIFCDKLYARAKHGVSLSVANSY